MRKQRTWTSKQEPLTVPYQDNRGRGRTLIGAIGGDPFHCIYTVADKTNTECVLAFLNHFITKVRHPLNKIDIYTDNHSAHHSKKVTARLAELGLRMKFIPPYSSTLNPIEHWWSLCKREWRKWMSKVQVAYDNTNIERDALMILG